jgi:murein DD-endopeptidase MepM/ murein hydrolase activator NlpD
MHNYIPTAGSFHRRLISTNDLGHQEFKEWSFRPGMLFDAKHKWWGNRGVRSTPHEGLDIAFFNTATCEMRRLPIRAKVPAIFDGEIIKVSSDFLGKSIFVRLKLPRTKTPHLFTIYAHTEPYPGIETGLQITEGDIIATVAETGRIGVPVPSHLHVSLAWIPDGLSLEMLDWKYISDRNGLILLDPLPILNLPHSVVDQS